jgi:hypothetical protein
MTFSVLPMEMLSLRDAQRMVKWLKSNKDVPHRAGPDACALCAPMPMHSSKGRQSKRSIDMSDDFSRD